jgi:hypothetical protein
MATAVGIGGIVVVIVAAVVGLVILSAIAKGFSR